jgi:uncharacterized membrane protein
MNLRRSSLLRLLPLLGLTAMAACATEPGVHSPVRHVSYSALGHDPLWLITIGDDRIVFTLGDAGGRADGALESFSFPRTLPRIEGVVRTWQSGDGTGTITIVARQGPCTGSGGLIYEDHVTVRLSGRELIGCGGRSLGEGSA